MSVPSFAYCQPGYAQLWQMMQIHPDKQELIDTICALIIRGKDRYTTVARETSVPWFVIGIIHYLEADCNFKRWLHNGDPMFNSAGQPIRTVDVPAGRPIDPAVTWEAGAVDALKYDGLDKVTDWGVERIAYEFEGFNGFGYRQFRVNSPYLWSFTNHYTAGRYIADHVWSAAAVSKECGAMPVLATLAKLDASVALALGKGPSPPPSPPVKPPGPPVPPVKPPAPPPKPFFLQWIDNILDWLFGWKGR